MVNKEIKNTISMQNIANSIVYAAFIASHTSMADDGCGGCQASDLARLGETLGNIRVSCSPSW